MTQKLDRRHATQRAATCLALVALWGSPLLASAQAAFPKQKAITLVVPFAAGGGNDILARAIAPRMAQLLGQTVVVDNRPGAGGNLGTELVARAAPDGYTIVIASSQVTMNPFLDMKLPFRIEKDFEPIGLLASVPLVLVTPPTEPYKTLPELIAYAKANPGKLNYSSPGNGTPQHMAGEVFAKLTKTELVHVPYKGTAPSVTDLIAGQVQLSFATYASIGQFLQAGKLRALGVAGQKRTSLMPELQTFGDAGIKGYDAGLWYSLLAPANTPPAIVTQLNDAMVRALSDPAVARQLAQQGFETQTSSPAELRQYIADELKRWQRVITENNIKVAL